MLPVADVPGAEAQRLIRPLLETRRSATETICAEFELTPLQDPSNADPKYTRNRVRNETLSALRAINPEVQRALTGLAASAREAFEPIERRSFEVQPRERGPVGAIFDAAKFGALPAEALGLVIDASRVYHLEVETNRTRCGTAGRAGGKSGTVRFGDAVVEVSSGCAGGCAEAVEPFEPASSMSREHARGPWRADVRTEQ